MLGLVIYTFEMGDTQMRDISTVFQGHFLISLCVLFENK